MFHVTGTFLLIFMILNHDFAAARSVENIAHDRVIKKRKAPDMEIKESHSEQQSETARPHIRRKRGWGSLVKTGLGVLAGSTFALSVGTTVYQAIRECKDFTPDPCKNANCTFLDSCHDACVGPDSNREYLLEAKQNVQDRLDVMDQTQTNAFNLATKAVSASLNTKRIFTEIDRINNAVDQLMFDLVDLDIEISTKFRNKSIELKAMLRDERFKLNDITVSPEMQGIFDKWTWEGTGAFVLSLALPVGLKMFSVLRERYAIHKLYTEMKADFAQRFITQKATVNPNGATQPKLKNKFAYVQGYSTKQINSQLKKTASAVYKADQANKKATKTEKFTNNVLGPLVNIVVSVLSVWQFYQFYSYCQSVANDMQESALNITNQRNRIEEMKQNEIDPLYTSVQTEAWGGVKDLLTNESTTDWLLSIRNLTLEAAHPNTTTAGTIENFVDTIEAAGVDATIALQGKLIPALESVQFEFQCYSDKQHAVTLVVKDCRSGRDELAVLYDDANSKYKLNRQACIDNNMVPYTTLEEFRVIVGNYSEQQGWYSNCLLNDEDLLIRVCNEKLKGYDEPAEIVEQVNKTALTEDMVSNFLTRCPPPQITPKSREDTCYLYCLYENVTKIAKTVILLESQVEEIIANCSICSVRDDQKTDICYEHFCKGQNASTIEPQVRLPLPTVNHVINNVCVQKCLPSNEDKQSICLKYKCKYFTTASKLAGEVVLPLATVNEVTPSCDTILSTCPEPTSEEISQVKTMNCYNLPASTIAGIVNLPLATVEKIIAENVSIVLSGRPHNGQLRRRSPRGDRLSPLGVVHLPGVNSIADCRRSSLTTVIT